MKPERYAQVKEVFLRALDVSATERDTFIRSACGDDDELLTAVDGLLAHHDSQTILAAEQPTQVSDPGVTFVGPAAPKRPFGSQPSVPWLGPNGRLAIGVILASLLLAAVGLWQRQRMQLEVGERLSHRLAVLRDANLGVIEQWLADTKTTVESWARDKELRDEIVALGERAENGSARDTPEQDAIRRVLQQFAGEDAGYVIWNRRFVVIADRITGRSQVGETVAPAWASVLTRVFRGETVPLAENAEVRIEDEDPEPHFYVVTPIRDGADRVIAAMLLFNTGIEKLMNRVLSISRVSKTSETYVFGADGVMRSESRFDKTLRAVGLIDDRPDSRSSGKVTVRDPGGDLTQGFKPDLPAAAWPLTRAASRSTAGLDGVDISGYRNYLGVRVVGAWVWLDEYRAGVATEMSYDEAYGQLAFVEEQFFVSFGLLTLAVAGLVYSIARIVRLRRRVGESSKVGPYTLERWLGEGGMGRVYLGRHQMLKRAVAVKLLKADVANRRTRRWFEREVQTVSQLTHPNTIQIYDYGQTPDGVFYYVMEYLPGISLGELVDRFGAIPSGRAAFLLKQICRSLREAHEQGLVHRDIKPRNVMLCRRGGVADFVKVLDFGLVKQIAGETTEPAVIAGTPVYMAPEQMNDPASVGPSADIYAWGAVAFKLLTGRDPFHGGTAVEVLFQVLETPPPDFDPLEIDVIPPELRDLVLRCLAKSPHDRPASVDELLAVLNGEPSLQWTTDQANAWWDANGLVDSTSSPAPAHADRPGACQ